MNDFSRNIKIKFSSEKNFGYTFSIIFLILSIYFFFQNNYLYLLFIICSICILLVTIFFQKILKYPNIYWNRFGLFLGSIISPIIILLTYFITILPAGVFFKLRSKDIINLKIDYNTETYWQKRKTDINKMEKQY